MILDRLGDSLPGTARAGLRPGAPPVYTQGMLPIDPRASQRIEDFLAGLSRDELAHLQTLVVERIKLIGRRDDSAVTGKLKAGDDVLFSHAGRGVRGRVVKINRSTVLVEAADGRLWKVSGRLLHRVEN